MSAPGAAIITIGSELLAGDGLDTNSAWLSRRLTRLGFACRLHTSCPDDMGAVVGALEEAMKRAEVVLVTGGLGPTSDDITREAVARFLGVSLELHAPALERLETLFARFGRSMPPSNRKQAEFPQGARVLRTEVGTAPGFVVEQQKRKIYVLPGVPREVYWFWDRHLSAELAQLSEGALLAERTFRTVGISESSLGERLEPLEREEGLELRYAAEGERGTIRVTLLCAGQDRIQPLWLRARELVGADHVCALGNDLLPESVAGWLFARAQTLATAESCTGGRVAAALTAIPGVSRVFQEGLVTYSNAAKTRLLGVPEPLLAEHGAVSAEVAEAMARGARARAGTDLGLGVTGIAGPGGGSEEKPVGLVYMAVAGPGNQLIALRRRYPGERILVQARATAGALDLIRRAVTQ